MTRTKLRNRVLPDYTVGEEIMNMVTHIAGGALAVVVTVLCILRAAHSSSALAVVGAGIYGFTMLCLYTISSVYHGLTPSTGKKVMQVLDHCAIYFLISGTYTPILLAAFIPAFPVIGWSLLTAQWVLAATACTLTAIDLHNFRVLSMICYITMGWSILLFLPQAVLLLGKAGFLWLLWGGIAYTVGAILYGIGAKRHWMHSVFHIFVVLGSALQFIAIYLYVL